MATTVRAIFVKNPLTIIGGIVTLVSLLVVMLLVLNNSNGLDQGTKTLLVTTILGLVVNAIPSLLSLLKTEDTQHDIRNGVVKGKVREAVEEIADDPTSPANVLVIPAPTEEERNKQNG